MTELASAPADTRAETKRINHWIGGRAVPGESGRSGAVYNPATGEQTGEVDFASRRGDRRGRPGREGGVPRLARDLAGERAELMFAVRELVHEQRDEVARILTHEHGKVLSDALRRGRARARGDRVRLRHPAPPQGRLVRAGLDRDRRLLDPAAARRRRRHHAVQLPGDGAHVDVGAGARVRQHLRAQAVGEGPVGVDLDGRAAEGGGRAGRRLQRRARRQGRPSTRCSSIPDVAAVSFVGSTPIARYIYETGTRNGKRVQALGGAKNHMIVLPDADIDMAADAAVSAAYGSAGERCMAVSLVVAVGDAADPLVAAIKERLPKIKVGNGLEPDVEMGPLVTREHRDKVAGYIEGARRAGRDRRRRRPRVGARGRRLLPRRVAARRRDAGDGRLSGRDLRPGARRHARLARTTRRVKLVNENPYGNGTAIFTRDGGVARQFQFEVEAGMVGINVPIPVPVAYYSFGGWKASLFGDTHIYGPEGINFYTRGKVVTSRWPDPAT